MTTRIFTSGGWVVLDGEDGEDGSGGATEESFPWYDARWAGVVADGVTNDLVDFQTAIDNAYAADLPLQLPGGTIFISGGFLEAKGYIRGAGRGQTIISQGSTNQSVFDFDSQSNWEVSDLSIVKVVGSSNPAAIMVRGEGEQGLIRNVSALRGGFYIAGDEPSWATGSPTTSGRQRRVILDSLWSEDAPEYGISVESVFGLEIINPQMISATVDGVKLLHTCDEVTVTGGFATLCGQEGMDGFMGGNNVAVTGFKAYDNTGSGVIFKTDDNPYSAPDFQPQGNLTLTGLICRNNGSSGLQINRNGATDDTALPLIHHVSVLGGVFEGNTFQGILLRARNVSIVAPVVRLNGSQGILIDSPCMDCEVISAQVSANSQSSIDTYDGVNVQGTRNRVIGGFSLGKDDTDIKNDGDYAGATAYQRYGVVIESGSTDCSAADVTAHGNITGQVASLDAEGLLRVRDRLDMIDGAGTRRTLSLDSAGDLQVDGVDVGGGGSGQPGGGLTWVQEYDTSSTAASDPGNTLFRLNNATQGSATAIYCDDLDINSTDVSDLIGELATSSSAILGYLRLVQADDFTDWILFTVTNLSQPVGYSDIAVSFVAQSGANPFADGDDVIFLFTPTGDQGDAGADGTTPSSILDYAQIATSQGSITSETDITGLDVTWTADSAKDYLVTCHTPSLTSTVTTDRIVIRLADSSNTQVQQNQVAATVTQGTTTSVVLSGLSGSVTYKARATRVGSGTVTVGASGSGPAFIMVQDLTGGGTVGEIVAAGGSLPSAGSSGLTRMYKDVMFLDNGLYWWPIGGRMEQIAVEFTHFINNNAQKLELQSSVNGTGATVSMGTVAAGTQGIAQLDTGTTNAGRASYAAGQSAAMRGTADKEMLLITRLRFPTLSTVSEEYYFQVGFINSLTATAGDGFYFRYDRTVSANWYAVVVNNGTGTAGVDTGTAVATDTFQKLRIEVDEPGVEARFYIDGTLETTITTNFPGTTRDFGPAVNLRKTAGTTARVCDVDYFGYWSLMTTTV